MAPITNPISSHVLDHDELKANLDNIQRFLDISQQIESFFIRKRAIFSDQKPEFALNEEINELKSEIARKDNLLNNYHEKLNNWSNIVNDALAGKHLMDNTNQMVPPQRATVRLPGSNITSPMNPNHMQHPMIRTQGVGSPVPMVGSGQHSFNPMTNTMQNSPAQTPLAYLEQTMAHIGMNDNRR